MTAEFDDIASSDKGSAIRSKLGQRRRRYSTLRRVGSPRDWWQGLVKRLRGDPQLWDERFVTSCFVSSTVLFVIRALVLVYNVCVLATSLALNLRWKQGRIWPAYYTVLCYFGTVLYFWFATYNTGRYLWHKHRARLSGTVTTRMAGWKRAAGADEVRRGWGLGKAFRWMRKGPPRTADATRGSSSPALTDAHHDNGGGSGFGMSRVHEEGEEGTAVGSGDPKCKSAPQLPLFIGGNRASVPHLLSIGLQWILYETSFVSAPFVTIVFWVFLHSFVHYDDPADVWVNISMHAFNTAFMLAEFALGRVKISYRHFFAIISTLFLYVGLIYTFYGAQHRFIYFLFDFHFTKAYIIVFCLLLLDMYCIIFVLALMMHYWRDRYFAGKTIALPDFQSRALETSATSNTVATSAYVAIAGGGNDSGSSHRLSSGPPPPTSIDTDTRQVAPQMSLCDNEEYGEQVIRDSQLLPPPPPPPLQLPPVQHRPHPG